MKITPGYTHPHPHNKQPPHQRNTRIPPHISIILPTPRPIPSQINLPQKSPNHKQILQQHSPHQRLPHEDIIRPVEQKQHVEHQECGEEAGGTVNKDEGFGGDGGCWVRGVIGEVCEGGECVEEDAEGWEEYVEEYED